jgi:hypothetical protein
MLRVLGTPVTFSSGQVALVWHGHGVATALNTYANNGLRVAFSGNAVGDWKSYTVGGSDVAPMPYGKWVNNAVDPSLTADATNGTPPSGGTNIYGIGSMCQQTAVIGKGQPHVCDIIRYGRAEARFANGDLANGYATFAGFAALNDAQTARWGLIQAVQGGYQWKGLMTLGYSTAVDFRDSNVNVFIQDTRKVSSTFNKIEIRQASSRVDWTGVSFICVAPTTTASKGDFAVIDNADVNFESCSFTDMGTFGFLSNSTVNRTTFRRCGLITTGGGVFSNCTFDQGTGSVAVTASSPANAALITDSTFISDGSGNGLQVTGTAANFTVSSTFTGYSGTSTDAAIWVDIASGNVEISYTGGGAQPSIRTSGATVTFAATSVTVAVKVKDATSGNNVPSARVLIEKVSDGTDILAGVTDANGELSTSFSYTASTDVIVRVRRASTDLGDGTLYKAFDGSGTITAGGFNQTISLQRD